jgi:hypothetical protein
MLLFKKTMFVATFAILHCLIIYNFYYMAKDTVNGDSSAVNMIIQPRYNFMRVPTNKLTIQYSANNRVSADFAQIYFAARDSSSNVYGKKNSDPWDRRSTYAPFVNTVCQYTICSFPYGYASLSNILIQLLLLYGSFFFAFKILNIARYLLPSVLLINTCLFITPVGLAWFERGQFSVYVTLASLWLIMGIIKKSSWYMLIAALFAYLKWTSLPFIFIVLSLWMLNSKTFEECKSKCYISAIIPMTFFALLLLEPRDGVEFLFRLIEYQNGIVGGTLSIGLILQKDVAKWLPLILIMIGYMIYTRKQKDEFTSLMPYLAACGIFTVMYPAKAYDYSVPALFCFIPLLIYWAERTRLRRRDRDLKPGCWPESRVYFFATFLLVASNFDLAAEMFGWPSDSIVYFYSAAALIIVVSEFLCSVGTGGPRIKSLTELQHPSA